MKITRNQLRQIIKEELDRSLIIETPVYAPPIVKQIRSRMIEMQGADAGVYGNTSQVADWWQIMLNYFKRFPDAPSRRKSTIAAANQLIAPAPGGEQPAFAGFRGWRDRAYIGTEARPDCDDDRCEPCEEFANLQGGISSLNSVDDEVRELTKVLEYVLCAINPKSPSAQYGPQSVDHYQPLYQEMYDMIVNYGEKLLDEPLSNHEED